MKKFLIDKASALGGNAPYNLVTVEDAYDWSSGTKGPRTGTIYTILRMSDLEKQAVRIVDDGPAIAAESVQQCALAMAFVKVDFDGFSATVAVDKTGHLRIYAEAAAIRILQPQNSGKKEA